MASPNHKVRYGVVGLGWFAQAAVLPAFANAGENSELVALFSGDEVKRQELADRYQVSAYTYEKYETVLARGEIVAVYIVSPNSQHNPDALPAARHGVHVLCEKPLADSVEAAQEMIDACEENGVKLMTAYRLHLEEANLTAVELIRSGKIGEPRLFESVNTFTVEEGNTRLDSELGGSPLLDVGVYCINAVRYLFREDPIEAAAFAVQPAEPRFRKVPDMVSAILRFPRERLGMFTCGFGEAKVSSFRVVGTRGDLRMEPSYVHNAPLRSYLTVDGSTEEKQFRARDQVGPEIVYFSQCILDDRQPEPDGYEGLADLRVIEAIQLSMEKGRSVPLSPFKPKPRPTLEQHIKKPKVAEPELVHASPPQE